MRNENVNRHIGRLELEWDDSDGEWVDPEGDDACNNVLCGDDSDRFIPEAWREETGEIVLSVYENGADVPRSMERRSVVLFYLVDHERIMVNNDSGSSNWSLFPIHDSLDTFLREGCECSAGHCYTAVFTSPGESDGAVSVTKRRRIVIDVEVTVELDHEGRPISSLGNILYEEGSKIIDRLKNNPHFSQIKNHKWNVDHMVLDEIGAVVSGDNDDDYLKFNDRPGVWSGDRINKRG